MFTVQCSLKFCSVKTYISRPCSNTCLCFIFICFCIKREHELKAAISTKCVTGAKWQQRNKRKAEDFITQKHQAFPFALLSSCCLVFPPIKETTETSVFAVAAATEVYLRWTEKRSETVCGQGEILCLTTDKKHKIQRKTIRLISQRKASRLKGNAAVNPGTTRWEGLRDEKRQQEGSNQYVSDGLAGRWQLPTN